jgi:D-sedoheptulose 7-phosphate isomerase
VSAGDTGFLYPFIEAAEHDPGPLLEDLAASARLKARESAALQLSTLDACAAQVAAAASAMAERFTAGGRLYCFGNGGSSTDAATLTALFASPPDGRALGNDVGFELVFSRQLIALAGPSDIAVAMSTSGNSGDLVQALAEASARGLLTIGFAGYDGGWMAVGGAVDHCFVVDSQSVHRIQESQALLGYELWAAVQRRLAGDTPDRPYGAGGPA